MAFRNAGVFDSLLELRDIADGAETSTAAETGVAFECRKIGAYKCKLYVSAAKVSAADETYVFNVEVSDAVGGTYTAIAELNFAAAALAAGEFEIPLSGVLADQMDADADFVRIKCTLGGTSPSVTYGAYLTKM